MTGYTVHSGSNEKFADGWDRIFGNSDESETPPKAKKSTKSKRPAASAKSTKKKSSRGKK